MDLSKFNTQSLFDAATDFFNQLGVKTNSNTAEPLPIDSILKEFLKETNTFKAIDKTYFIGLVDNDVINNSNGLFENKISYAEVQKIINNEYKGLMVFAVNILEGIKPTANQLRDITRAFNRISEQIPVVVIYKTGDTISFSNCERIKYRQEWRKGEKVGKVSILYNVNINNPHQGHIRILKSLAVEEIKKYDKSNRVESFNDLHKAWINVFSTDVLNRQFYLDYQKLSVKLINAIYPHQIPNKLVAHQGVLNLLNRIMFIYFVQKKEWIMNDENFIIHFWKDYRATGKENVFHEEWLNSIFFSAFNGIAYRDPKAIKALPEPYKSAIIEFPFLNGGLFSFNEDYDKYLLPDSYFESIFDFFEGYIFTISEDTPYDVNLEINPELLGKMYEGMINATDLDDIDAENGIVYTERAEINFMARRSFVEVLDKKLNGSFSREFLYHFIFDEPVQKLEILKRYKPNIDNLRQSILTITACDSACGSGSMILGVIQLQMELIRALDFYTGKPHTPNDDFQIKKQLISECIYGVDIKEWAVRIAELRLWLYMIAEAEFTKKELTKYPLLPNLDFKLRKGNSLIQKFGTLDFSLEELLKNRKKTSGATKKLNDFIKKKKEFIINQNQTGTSFKKLKAEEYSVFLNFIDELIIEKDIRLRNLGKREKQIRMFAEPEQQEIDIYAPEKEEIKTEIEKLKKLRESIHKEKKLPFSYDIDFMEIFITNEDAGFDLIISNPPYVRQEEILPPEDGEYLEFLLHPENKTEKAKVNKEYKNELNDKVYRTYPFLSTSAKTEVDGKLLQKFIYGKKVPGRSDLFCYFQLLCPSFLNSKGTLCYIIGNSWLDTEYGSYIQHFLLKHTKIYAIYDSNIRSFDAKVNTIIYLHSGLLNISGISNTDYRTLQPINNIVPFILNKLDYSQAAYAPLLIEQENCKKNSIKELYRVIPKNQTELYSLGYDEQEKEYVGDKWGSKWLSSPEIFFKIIEKSSSIIKPLKSIVSLVQRNTYEVFNKIVETDNPTDNDIPYLSSSKLLSKIYHKPNEILNYISSSKSKYKSGHKHYLIPDLISNRFIGDRVFFVQGDDYVVGDTFFVAQFKIKEKKEFYVACLNCTLSILNVLVTGRKNMGDGVLLFYGPELRNLPVILPEKRINEVLNIYSNMKNREIFDMYTELGFDKTIPIRSQTPKPLNDRSILDKIFFEEINLTLEEINEVYWSVGDLLIERSVKAASR